ncbi:MAG: AbrB/MazE/SpoVT family DNA-binding domain-containing protein [Candidatus Hydrogenedentota bacterium]
MVKTLTKVGNSYAIVIDKPILDALHITPETPLEIETDGRQLVIHPMRTISRDVARESFKRVMEEHAEVFKRLAE